jgi:hypothetical protein
MRDVSNFMCIVVTKYSSCVYILYTEGKATPEDNTKMDVQEVGGGRGDWIKLA